MREIELGIRRPNLQIASGKMKLFFCVLLRSLTVDKASGTMKCVGRLAQRLERSVYTRKVIRSNRILPTIRA
jgi:hypothetical protein